MSDIAVLLPHYNRLDGLKKTLNSISETEPVDIIVIDDGSKHPPSKETLQEHYSSTGDIEIISLPKNKGIEHALNEGLKYVIENPKYKYIARLDCGDRCAPSRFHKQKKYLDQHQDISIVGTWVSFTTPDGRHLYYMKHPTNHKEIEKKMCTDQRLIHASIMFRREAVKVVGEYSYQYTYSEDYDFIFRFVNKLKAANIPEVLMYCEVNPKKGISVSNRKRQLKNSIQIIWRYGNWKRYPLHFIYGITKKSFLYLLPYRLEWGLINLIRKYSNRGIYKDEK
jgi:GT2 family glycosyltransferase